MPVLHAGVLTVRACRMSDERRNVPHTHKLRILHVVQWSGKIESSNLCFAKYPILFHNPPPALYIATLRMYWPQNKNIFWLYNQNIAFYVYRQHLRFALNWWTCMQPFDVDMCQNHDPLILSLVHVYILNLVLNLVARRISIKIKVIFWRARILALQKITSILISVGNSSHR